MHRIAERFRIRNLTIFRSSNLPILFAAVLLVATAPAATAQEAAAGKELTAYRINGESPRVDGRIDEEIWVAAQAIDDFTQQEPDNMAAPRERTVVQVAYDDRYLYVAVRCYAQDPSTISAGLGRRGSIPASDRITIALDPRHDHLTGYAFTTNPSGVQHEDHVYGRLRRHVLNITGRGTYAFSRDMTLEVFLQPFVAVGDYHDIRKLAAPSSFSFAPVTLEDNPDFNRKSIRGNIVLRWEYVRGSTLFVVWNMATSDESRAGLFSAARDLQSAFGAPGTHVFVVKLNYWLSL